MSRRVKRKIFSGCVCEQEVYRISDKSKNVKAAKPRLRFKSEEERQKHKEGISRRRHARLVNENFSSTSYYSTFTFDNENEIHTFDDAKHIRDLFVRRLKYAFPNAVIFIYLGRGRNTKRIHVHMLSEGVPEETLRKQWIYGTVVDIAHLRAHNYYGGVDYGQDYTGLANYLFDHWTPEQGGHRWKQTRNARSPDKESVEEIKRIYTEKSPPKAPKGYKLVETKCNGYGYMYFKYVKEIPAEKGRKSCKRAINSS